MKITSKPSKKLKGRLGYVLVVSLVLIGSKAAQANPELIADGFDLPWSVEFLNDRTVLISGRKGTLTQLNVKDKSRQDIEAVWDVWFGGQGGLLDLALHPNYDSNGWIYATFAKQHEDGAGLALVRFKILGFQVSNLEELFVSNAVTGGGRHFGSRMVFDKQGYLYVTSGDRGEREWAQRLDNHAGTVLRFYDDGRIPEDNPFTKVADAQPEIWSYGHRNPQGIAYDPSSNRLWVIEHGPRGGDEINLIRRGANYGWPVISYGKEYWGPVSVGEGTHKEGMEQPIKYYDPSIAPGSLALLEGDLFAGALKLRHLNRVALNEKGEVITEQRILSELEQRIRDVIAGPDGALYMLTDQGNFYRYEPD